MAEANFDFQMADRQIRRIVTRAWQSGFTGFGA
jgi:hypothetical protein